MWLQKTNIAESTIIDRALAECRVPDGIRRASVDCWDKILTVDFLMLLVGTEIGWSLVKSTSSNNVANNLQKEGITTILWLYKIIKCIIGRPTRRSK